jgi:hypothetical protein
MILVCMNEYLAIECIVLISCVSKIGTYNKLQSKGLYSLTCFYEVGVISPHVCATCQFLHMQLSYLRSYTHRPIERHENS